MHIYQDAFDVLKITFPQLAKSLAIFLSNVLFAKANTLLITRDVKFTRNFKNFVIQTQETTYQLNQQPIQSKNHSVGEYNPSSSHNKTYTNVTSNREPPKSHNNQSDTSLIRLLSKFISDFQALMNPLLTLLTTVLTNLAAQNDK